MNLDSECVYFGCLFADFVTCVVLLCFCACLALLFCLVEAAVLSCL